MKNEPIKTLPYSEVKFRFVINHYDIHYNGTCTYKEELCEFKTIDYREEEGLFCEIYDLTFIEKVKWK